MAYFGDFGGQFVPEILTKALKELEDAFFNLKEDKDFQRKLNFYLTEFAGRPTPLYFAKNLSKKYGGKIYLKREDLLHTGAHKINNTLGQVLLAKELGKTRIIAETGAGQHGVATATAAALFGLSCDVYMGEEDIERQRPNVFRMEMLGARVIPVSSGSKTLKDAINEALRDWVTNVKTTHYVIGSVVGPHPYPIMVREFQRVIGKEAKKQIIEKEGKLPDYIIACVGGGSNAAGIFYDFIDEGPKIIGVEAGGKGVDTSYHAATLNKGKIGVVHGSKTYILQEDGQITPTHSVSAGLDYPGVGPEHSFWKDTKKVIYDVVTDDEAVDAFFELSRSEGIIPALESAHAIAYLKRLTIKERDVVIVNLSGRGDKDLDNVKNYLKERGR